MTSVKKRNLDVSIASSAIMNGKNGCKMNTWVQSKAIVIDWKKKRKHVSKEKVYISDYGNARHSLELCDHCKYLSSLSFNFLISNLGLIKVIHEKHLTHRQSYLIIILFHSNQYFIRICSVLVWCAEYQEKKGLLKTFLPLENSQASC